MDPALVEFEGADPGHVANAKMMKRFSKGRRGLQEGDEALLKRIEALYETVVENGAKEYQENVDVCRSAWREKKSWPAGERAIRLAEEIRDLFQNWADRASGAGDPVRVLRGGSFRGTAEVCRSAYRVWDAAGDRGRGSGFRVALVPGPAGEA